MKKRLRKKYTSSVLRVTKTPFEGLRVGGKYAKTIWNRVGHLYNVNVLDYSSLRSRYENSADGVTVWREVQLINPIPFEDVPITKASLEFTKTKLKFSKNKHYIFWCPDTYSGKGCICVCKSSTWEGC